MTLGKNEAALFGRAKSGEQAGSGCSPSGVPNCRPGSDAPPLPQRLPGGLEEKPPMEARAAQHQQQRQHAFPYTSCLRMMSQRDAASIASWSS